MTDLRKYARGKECMIRIPDVCRPDPDTTVLAHLRMAPLSGFGLKPNDLFGAWACFECHNCVDGRSKAPEGVQVRKLFLEGVLRTQYELIKAEIISW